MDLQEEVLEGRPATDWEVFMIEFGKEAYKQMLPRVDAAIQRVITLTTALVGGTIFFVNADQLPTVFRFGSMACFLGALMCALAGSELFSERVPLDQAKAIEALFDRMADERHWWLRRAYGLLYGGLFVAATGVLLKAAQLWKW